MNLRVSVLVTCSVTCCTHAQSYFSIENWPTKNREQQHELETALTSAPSVESLRRYHELLGSEPHVAGTPGDHRNIELQLEAFRSLGLDVERHAFWTYLSYPQSAQVQIIPADDNDAADVIDLPIIERSLEEDPYTSHPDLNFGWNAYSGSGDVTGEVVYANYGTLEDFQKLRELGFDLSGKIVIARYGKNFRGYKAQFAQQAGAAALIMYTDPIDSGYTKGVPYPEAGWANDTYIQRGSIKTLSYPGDPLTPGQPATQDARRLAPDSIPLPHIPVQPIGYKAAGEIMTRMNGTPVPQNLIDQWQGGLPCAYRLTGGSALRVRVSVEQLREIRESANVIATIPGSLYPKQKIVIGCHHDAWGFGAGDPLAGTILVFEAAKSFSNALKEGFHPARTIIFATWGAEEYGIIGSTEYCEQYAQELSGHTVAYINLDMAAMGPKFRSSASPTLKTIIEQTARDVPAPPLLGGITVYDSWKDSSDLLEFGNLGGGSDHIGFYCHLGIPSCHLGSGGALGVSYHSNYDTINWYHHVVGNDYQPAIMLTRMVNLIAARLANAPILPIDPTRYGSDFATHLTVLETRATELEFSVDFAELRTLSDTLTSAAHATLTTVQEHIQTGGLDQKDINRINEHLISLEQDWLQRDGLPEREWYQNLFAATDPDSGYAAWMLPALRLAIERQDSDLLFQMESLYKAAISMVLSRLEAIDEIVTHKP